MQTNQIIYLAKQRNKTKSKLERLSKIRKIPAGESREYGVDLLHLLVQKTSATKR